MRRTPKKLSRLDWIILVGLLACASFVVYRMFFDLNYRWNWSIIPTYLIRYDDDRQRWMANALLEGFLTTIRLSCWGICWAC